MAEAETAPTLRETLQESIATHTQEPVTVEPVAPVAAEALAPDETAEQTAGRLAGRARAPDGKLLPGKAVKPAQEAIPAVLAPEVPAAPAVVPVPRPSSWGKEMWPLWDKLNTGAPLTAQEARQVAEYNAKRESQFATGVSTYKGIADAAKPLMDAIAPFQPDLDRHGIKAPDMVHRLMAAHSKLALGSPQEKLQLFGRLAQDYGIPIQALYDQAAQTAYLSTPHTPQPAQAQQQPPDIAALIEQTLANREVKQTVESMAKDAQKYPFFSYVRPTMAQLLESGEATDLDDAYQKALGAPEHAMLSTVQANSQAQAAETARVAAAQAAAKVARANTVSTKSATPATTAPDGKKGVRAALTEAIEAHRGGARV